MKNPENTENTEQNELVPEPGTFAEWVILALYKLGKSPSNFLLDKGAPGSRNRVRLMLRHPDKMRMQMANRLEREIRAEAARCGVRLGALPKGFADARVSVSHVG